MESQDEKIQRILRILKKRKEMTLSGLAQETKIGYYLLKHVILQELQKQGNVVVFDKGNAYQYVKLKAE